MRADPPDGTAKTVRAHRSRLGGAGKSTHALMPHGNAYADSVKISSLQRKLAHTSSNSMSVRLIVG